MSLFWESVSQFFGDLFTYAMIAVFLENTIFSRALGSSTALFAVRKKFNVILVGLIMTGIITLASILVYFINPLVRSLPYAYYITPAAYVGVIAVVYVAALLVTRRFVRAYQRDVLSIIHVSAFNCASLGALMLASEISGASLGAYLGFAVGSGLGFTLAMFLVKLAYERLSSDEVPQTFRGFPITLLYIGLVSLALYGLIGHQLPF